MDRREAFKVLAAAPLSASALVSCAAPVEAGSAPARPATLARREPPREFRGVWVATVDNIDWPSKPALPAEVQKAEIDTILETAQRLELNAVFLQVRPTADAFYPSSIEPWSAFLTGRQGQAPRPAYDPLAYWVEQAHARGIDLHAWVNPFRARHIKSIGPDHPSHVANMFPNLVRKHNGYLWMDPGAVQAREITMRVIDDLLTRYALDGIHMDDYFYPYPKAGEPFPDAAIYETYKRNGGTLTLEDWRRDNINRVVREVNTLVQRRRPGALFTVSPFGIWRPEHPPGIKGFDAFNGLYADSRRWLAEGWCDALIPQLYWPIASPGQPFEPLMNWWIQQNTAKRHLWPGLYLTRIQPESDGPDAGWKPEEIINQIRLIQQNPGASGFALFSMVGMLQNRRSVADLLTSGPLAAPALVPESPWLNAPRPQAPTALITRNGIDLRFELTPGTGAPTRRYVVQTEDGPNWRGWVLPAGAGTVRTTLTPLTRATPGTPVTVTPIGPNGVTGSAARVIL
ncbi:glycoside hydrolase family 10 protein [Nodularia spumigena]|uniref:glycoside hydrolase family 10 protein n=1 Tax=Nodularia spumigena TaxID=70799 RepID=UPI002B207983|nr:family 10 glycosylhydrolase [Nodularia spumigena]MEA5612290.1 family 10 glycosylhydrolase [Nodularia spumigena UHCC 0040]